MKKKTVYVGLAADILHKGHINILKTANRYGNVIVGLLTDQAIASYKNIPYLNYEKRKVVIENIRYVKKVIPQNTLDYIYNLKLIKPDYVVHGDDWKTGVQKKQRKSNKNIKKMVWQTNRTKIYKKYIIYFNQKRNEQFNLFTRK